MARSQRDEDVRRVVICAADASLRDGLRDRLRLEPDVRVVGAVVQLDQAMPLIREQRPDVVIADAAMAQGETELIAIFGSDRTFGVVLLVREPAPGELWKPVRKLVRVPTEAPLSALMGAIRMVGLD
jgi:AmiR/NasT family two-component response regulator